MSVQPVCDPAYETIADPGTWIVAYDWEIRAYRRLRVQRVLFGRNVTPVDPDALLEPDYLPVGCSPAKAAQGRKAAEVLRYRTDVAVLECLRAHGPLKINEIVKLTGKNRDTVTAALHRRPHWFGSHGAYKKRIWYAREDAIP